jgi:hypothetical protein
MADTENSLVTWMYTWHMGSRRYTSHIRLVTIDIEAFLPPWHQGSYPTIEEKLFIGEYIGMFSPLFR